MQDEAIYKGNNASDYQPPTQNPQSAGVNIQQGASNLQPSGQQSDITQQRLPSVENLRVVIVQDTNSSTTAGLTPVEAATQTWMGPFWGCVILAVIGVIIWAVRVLAREEVAALPATLEAAAKEPFLEFAKATAEANGQETKKIDSAKLKKASSKKSAVKKMSKKKPRRR